MPSFYQNINELHLEVTPDCNLQCQYCFAFNQLQTDGTPRLMEVETALGVLKKVIPETTSSHLTITFHGGEPLLQSGEWFREVCQDALQLGEEHSVRIRFGMQSNLVLLSPGHHRAISDYRISVGSSLDGGETLHNLLRGEFKKTLENCMKLAEENLLSGVICVLTTKNAHQSRDFLEFLWGKGIRSCSFIECRRNRMNEKLDLFPGETELSLAWTDILVYMVETRGKCACDLTLLDKMHRFVNPPGPDVFRENLICTHPYCHAGILMVYAAYNGDLYPCGTASFADPVEYRLGKFGEEDPSWRDRIRRFHAKGEKYLHTCRDCEAAVICSFGCTAFSREDPKGEENRCSATRRFLKVMHDYPVDDLREVLQNTRDLQIHREPIRGKR